MIPLLTRASARAVDRDAVDRLGVSSLVLMENAGRGATDAIVRRMPDCLAHVVCVGGPGQNGGDAWVVARHLALRGHRPRAILVGDPAKVKGDAAKNLAALRAMEIPFDVVSPDEPLGRRLVRATLLVDGLFGTGLDRPLEGGYADAVRALDDADVPVVALDLPSGVDADTGAVLGTAVRAVMTVSFVAPKRGLHQFPGASLAGEVVVADIGVPAPASASGIIDDADLRDWLPPRASDAHKGTSGHVLVVAGSAGTSGAALLCGVAAYRAGAGKVTLVSRAALDGRVLELMAKDFASVEATLALADGMQSAVVGPGFGSDDATHRIALELTCPTVLDADALRGVTPESFADARGPRVLTPHPGEAAGLLGCDAAEVQRDRFAAAAALAERSGQVVVLKGARTVISDGERVRVCARGTSALGVAGTGDVLAGIIGALLVSLPSFDAAAAGVELHARAGERAAIADRGILAREVADALPAVFASMEP